MHHDCRRKFVDKRTISTPEAPKKKLRSSITGSFDWKSCCFLCSKAAERKYSTVFQVRTLPLLKTLTSHCENRDDDWGRDVQGRLLTCNDLVAEEAVYHITCMTKLVTSEMSTHLNLKILEQVSLAYSLMELAQKTLQPGQKSYRAHIWHRSPT